MQTLGHHGGVQKQGTKFLASDIANSTMVERVRVVSVHDCVVVSSIEEADPFQGMHSTTRCAEFLATLRLILRGFL